MKITKTRMFSWLGEGLLYAFVSAVFLAVASYFTSPLTGIYGSDSAFFQMVGQAMTQGMLPYRDFFDMKGPFFFLLQYLAQCISYGRLGCFILQIISLTLTLWFACHCLRLAMKKRSVFLELLCLIPCALVLAATMDGGNLTEEFALPTLVASLYMGLRTLMTPDRRAPAVYGFFYGFFFGLNALSRITNAALIGAVVFTVAVRLIRSRRFRALFFNAAAFFGGTAAAVVPFLLYYTSCGLLGDMLSSVFSFGVSYATEGGFAERFRVFSQIAGWELMLMLPAAVLLLVRSFQLDEWLLALSGFAFVSAVFLLGNAYVHYFVLVIPSLIYAAFLLIRHWKAACIQNAVVLLLTLCLFASGIWMQKPAFIRAKTRIADFISAQAKQGYSWESISGIAPQRQGIAALIPENELNSVYVYDLPMDFFCRMDFFPCFKYCCWQDHYVQLNPSIGKELRAYFIQTPPKWFLVRSSYTMDTLPEYFGDLTKMYEEFDASGDFKLLRLKTEGAV